MITGINKSKEENKKQINNNVCYHIVEYNYKIVNLISTLGFPKQLLA